MKIMFGRSRAAVATLAVCAMVASACGSDDTGTASPPADDDSATSTTTADDGGSESASEDPEWESIVEAANEEGRVVFYLGLPEPQHEAIAERFAQAYPEIDLEIVRVQTRELGGRIEIESQQGSGGADVIYSNSWSVWDPLEEKGLLHELKSPWIEARQDLWDEYPNLRMTENTVVFTVLPYLIVWNENLVDEPVTSYADLIDRADEFRGQVGAPDFLGVASQSWYAQLEEKLLGINLPEELSAGNELEDGYLRRFGELDPVIRDTALPLTQAVAAGEIRASIYTAASIVNELKAAGAPIEATLPSDAAVVNAIALGLPTYGDNPNAAQVLADFLLSEEGQKVNEDVGSLSLDEADPSLLDIPGRELSEPEFLTRFEQYWTEVMR